ncbi:MAG: hypothetical protein ACREGR_00905, partial [Minisyncoccia bacterium]
MTRQLVLPQPVRLFRPVRPGSTNLRFQDELAGTAEILKVADDLVVVGWDHNANLAFKVEGPKEGYI